MNKKLISSTIETYFYIPVTVIMYIGLEIEPGWSQSKEKKKVVTEPKINNFDSETLHSFNNNGGSERNLVRN